MSEKFFRFVAARSGTTLRPKFVTLRQNCGACVRFGTCLIGAEFLGARFPERDWSVKVYPSESL